MTLPELIPARILNEHVYCRRLAYLEWVDSEFVDNRFTAEGSFVHRNVDRERAMPPPPPDEPADPGAEGAPREALQATAITVSSARLGLIAKIDVLRSKDGVVVPVEYKRGLPRSPEAPLWQPELVQLCAQVLILRDCGYEVPHAEAYFAQTRSRYRVEITEELVAATLDAVKSLRADAEGDQPPPPLIDSPKCPSCSLVGICLPDEVNALTRCAGKTASRRLVAGDPASSPLYATTPGSRLSKRGGRLALMEAGKEVASRRLIDVSHIAVFGNVDVSSALLRACFEVGIPVLWLTAGGWFKGAAIGMPSRNVSVRMRQHRAAALGSPHLASAFVSGKIRNCRTLLRRHRGKQAQKVLSQLTKLAKAAEAERSLASLLGIEGTAARLYFSEFGSLLKRPVGEFVFEERNRRPPRDPVNALLSFFYALLVKDVTAAATAAGLDPYIGVFHRPGFGRPALALDLAEEFRPLLADSTVMMAINNGEITRADFIGRAGAVSLTEKGRRKAIASYERRIASELVHPIFRYKTSYRRALEIQARLLAAALTGDVPAYRPLTTR
ncbi:MAG TPA: CRISPR-associated endonuclease Cas1 [Solirubrobacteraceae bacterium]|nr:CRISPR-associated endonuclease Cas1 [Solirubrobacteraceae bacterium]